MSIAYVPSTGVRANSSSPAPMDTRLGISVASGPKRMLSGPEKRSDIVPMTIVDGRNARPTWSAS